MIYKKALICKTKNLFDISKVTNSSSIQSDDKDIICSTYGASIGVLKDLCPSLKVGDTVTLSLIVKSTTSVPPKFVQIQGKILYISTGSVTFTATEDGLNSNFYLYNTTYENRDVPTTTVFTDIMIELGDTATSYVPYGYLQSYKKAIKVSDVFVNSYKSTVICKTKNLFDISKVQNSTGIKVNGNDINVSIYGASIGLLKDICPSIKAGDTVTISFKLKSYTSEITKPNFLQVQNTIRNFSNLTFTVTEEGLNQPLYLYKSNFYQMDKDCQAVYTDFQIEIGTTATSYVPYRHL